ncbi:hypothetical protein [Oceanobacillus kimchii]|uniref:hypothetical protein n=1 Tax=Oceanobacillus kimchii TaxID=746691 RepID=UPI000347E95D|nr:hypothetical protein [Oceanobacillus kimchii]
MEGFQQKMQNMSKEELQQQLLRSFGVIDKLKKQLGQKSEHIALLEVDVESLSSQLKKLHENNNDNKTNEENAE